MILIRKINIQVSIDLGQPGEWEVQWTMEKSSKIFCFLTSPTYKNVPYNNLSNIA